MSGEFDDYEALHSLMDRHNLLSLFKKLTLRERVRRIVAGLKAEKHSGEYKWARLQLARLTAPVSAFLVPVVGIAILSLLASLAPEREREVVVRIEKRQDVEELDEKIELDKDPIQPPDPIQTEFTPDIAVQSDYANIVNAPTTELSPKPAELDAVSMVKSPVMMRGILGNRNPGMRGRAMKDFGGTRQTEAAVMRALRWLKKYQEEDGSWAPTAGGYNMAGNWDGEYGKTAYTAWGLLCFLAHGETPASPEFGKTVETAMKWLVDAQSADGSWPLDHRHNYGLPTAAYALSEASGMTKIPAVRYAAEKAIHVIIKGQQAGGGWTYEFEHSGRLDTSLSGWCVQAFKAAKMAELKAPGLEEAIINTRKVFQHHVMPGGWFQYATGGNPASYQNRQMQLTGAAVLALQLTGHAQSDLVKNGLRFLDGAEFDWQNPSGENPVWGWYYITQAKFHEGGETWDSWNKIFSRELVNNQTVVPEAIVDPNGKKQDIGYWPSLDRVTQSYIYGTTLSALQLMVYYRYLPTFQTPESLAQPAEEFTSQDEEIDIKISI